MIPQIQMELPKSYTLPSDKWHMKKDEKKENKSKYVVFKMPAIFQAMGAAVTRMWQKKPAVTLDWSRAEVNWGHENWRIWDYGVPVAKMFMKSL